MPAVTEQAVVGPIGSRCAHGHHGHPVDQEHDQSEDGQAQPAVGHDLIDLIGGGQLPDLLLLVAGLDDGSDVHIALVGDDAFGIVVQFLLGGFDVGLDVAHDAGVDLQLREDLVVPLEDLDGVPALLLLRQAVNGGLLDVRQSVLHRAGEGVHGNGLAVLGSVNGGLGGLHDAGLLQSGDLDHLAAQLTGQLIGVDLVAVLLHHVHHVDGHHNGDAQLGKLRGQVQVPLQVGAVDDVQDGIGPLADQVIPGYHFLQGVGGQGVNAGQVGDDDTVVFLQLAFLFLNGNAGPVTHELVGTGECVEKGGFTTVGVARQGNSQIHCLQILTFLN